MTAILSNVTAISDIDIALVDVAAGRRKLDPAWVETLSDLFGSQGQLSPIEVVAAGERYRLVFGHHRLAAAKLIGWKNIAAVVKDAAAFASEAEITLREITENLARRELSVLDRAIDIARWREIYEATQTVRKAGRPKKDSDPEEISTNFVLNFSDAAQAAFRVSRQTIFNALKVASISADVRDRIALHPIADNQSELLQLAAEPAARQADIVALIIAEPPQAGTVAGAIAVLDRVPPPVAKAGWERVADKFALLKPKEQRCFFELHEAAIQLWLKERHG